MAVGCRCTCLENNKIGRVMDWTASIAKRTAWAFVITFELSTAWMTHAQSMPPVVNPRMYRAPAGRYELTIDPSEVYGCGPASYCLRFADRERWSETLPFTLCEAAVTDAGQVVGYGYSRSPAGFPSHGVDRGPGDFIVVILDANGATRLKETVKRQQSNFLHQWPNPLADGLIVDAANDRAIVRVADPDVNRAHESWWIYRLSTATAEAKIAPAELMPDSEPARSILGARPIPGTPLILVHWWRYDLRNWQTATAGARFTLVDVNLKPVWSLELPKDYAVPGNEKAADELRDFIGEHGAILKSEIRGRFDLYFAADAKRVTFAVQKGAGGEWVVAEVASAPYQRAQIDDATPDKIPVRPLKTLAPVVLDVKRNGDKSPIRNVNKFVFDGEGRIAFLRQDEHKPPLFVLADQSGRVVRETPVKVELKADERWEGLCWVGGSRFVMTSSEPQHEKMSRGWWIDGVSGRLEPITGFDCPPVTRLVGFGDGEFVALATTRYKYTAETFLIAFDKHGKRIWTAKADFNNKAPGALFSPADVAVTNKGEIVVLGNIDHLVKSFDRAGHFKSRIDLRQAWGRAPVYPSKIAGDRDGGLMVEDSYGSSPFVRMRPDGAIRSSFSAKQPDGRAFVVRDGIQVAPDGRLWASDGHSIVRLTDAGVVDRVLGNAPDGRQLDKIAGMAIDRQGQIYAVESRTGSIHVFDADGKLQHICETKPTDFKVELWDATVNVRNGGDVYLGLANGAFAHFSKNGTRLKDEVPPSTESANGCLFQPGTDRIVAIGFHNVSLLERAGKVVRTIQRRPDGNWLARIGEVALAPDGSLAILAETLDRRQNVPPALCLYRSSGDPICTIILPKDAGILTRLAYDGRSVVVTVDHGVIIYDGTGTPLQRSTYEAQGEKNLYYHPYILPGGRSFALFDGKNPMLRRYELP
jgi:hypothetical protein